MILQIVLRSHFATDTLRVDGPRVVRVVATRGAAVVGLQPGPFPLAYETSIVIPWHVALGVLAGLVLVAGIVLGVVLWAVRRKPDQP
jgi:hypothetical protein